MRLQAHVDRIGRAGVAGWARDPAQPDRPAWITVFVDGREAGRCLADQPRAELGPCGFRFVFEPPLSVFTAHQIEVRAAEGGAVLPKGQAMLAAPSPAPEVGRVPLLLTSTGRSGSTMMMREFAHHPDIVVADRHPYEVKQIAYHAAAFRVLAAEANRACGSDPETMLAAQHVHRVGPNPYNDRGLDDLVSPRERLRAHFEQDVANGLAQTFRSTIRAYYAILADAQGKRAAPFFAEKGDIDPAARAAARLFFGAVREIVVLRDPRDLMCSAMAFWHLTAAQAFAMLQTTLPQLEAIHRSATPDMLVVRYEDLIRAPEETRRAMADFLGLDLRAAEAAEDAEMVRHRTSAGPAASVERWRQDLDPEWIGACDDMFARYMATFGYAAAEAAARQRRAPEPVVAEGGHAVARFLARNAAETPGGEALATVLDLAFGSGHNGVPMLGAGWSQPEDGYVWSDGPAATLRLPALSPGVRYRLRLVLAPFVRGEALAAQRLALVQDDAPLAELELHDLSVVECDLQPVAAHAAEPPSLHLSLPDAARPRDLGGSADDRRLGVSLRRLVLLEYLPPGADAPRPLPAPRAPADEAVLMARFESLGANCEFGLVQRRLGADPLGLLRFASVPLPGLLRALRKRFSGIGRPEFVQVRLDPTGREYMVTDRRFGFEYHAWVGAGAMAPEEIHGREVRRLPLLARKLVEDLTEGHKLFVYHGMVPMAEADMRELADAIRSYGPGTLLWVEAAAEHAVAENVVGDVVEVAPGLLRATIDRFAPGENAHAFSLEGWLAVCRAAAATMAR